MDYESRKIKWYWLLLFLLYCGTVAYMLFQNNPYLYARQELRASLDVGETARIQPIPLHPADVKATASTFFSRYNFERTGVDPATGPRSKNYEEFEKVTVDLSEMGFDNPHVSADGTGFYLSGKNEWVVALALDGKVRWKYKFRELPEGESLAPVLLDETTAYLVHPLGEVVALNKATGEIRWVESVKQELAALPFLYKGRLILPCKATTGTAIQMVSIDRANGKLAEDSPRVDLKPGFELADAPELGEFIATYDNKVVALNPDTWEQKWSLTVTDPIKGSAVVVGPQVYVATLAAKVDKIDGSKQGKLDWEADTEKPPASAPTFLPVVNRITVLDTSGHLSQIDAKSGKVYWRIPTENRNPLNETWSARLKGAHIEEFHMDWLQKGWTSWSPCFDNSFCIFTPKGLLVTRVHMSGRPMALPLTYDRRWVFLSQQKPGHFTISQIVEEAEIKRLRAEKTKEK